MVSSQTAYLAFVALLGLERIAELVLARRNAERAFAHGAIEVGQTHYRVMAAFHALFLFACVAEVLATGRAFPGALGWGALSLALGAQGLRYWAITTLGERWNVRVVVLPSAAPIVAGPYRWLRHPNYVAVALEMLAVPLVHGAWITALVFSFGNGLLMRVRIPAEEAALGPSYADTFARTPRFIPGGRG